MILANHCATLRKAKESMTQFRRLRKSVRDEAVHAGLLRSVAKQTGKSVSTVSRTFAGKFSRPNPDVVAALVRGLKALGITQEAA
jgi:hypothetical protein